MWKFEEVWLPQIVFAGRSNVGKSSLINALLCSSVARVSKTPGKTASINLFLVNQRFYLVDLPGYGYAKRSKAVLKGWSVVIDSYLRKSSDIRIVYVLVDSRIRITDMDTQLLEWLRASGIEFEVVFTKSDKKDAKAISWSVRNVVERLSGVWHTVSVKKRYTLSSLCESMERRLKDVLA